MPPTLGFATRCPPGSTTARSSTSSEREHLFLSHWQIVCHVSELPKPATTSFEFFGDRAVSWSAATDGVVRAFHNVCAHRAHAVVPGRARPLREVPDLHVPRLDLSPRRPQPQRQRAGRLPEVRPQQYGLKPIELEVFMGLLFMRFPRARPSSPSAWRRTPRSFAHYRIEQMVPLDEPWSHDSRSTGRT